jgi:hypothetical protein
MPVKTSGRSGRTLRATPIANRCGDDDPRLECAQFHRQLWQAREISLRIAEQFFDELTRSSPQFGLKRIEPVVEKIADHIGRRLQRKKSGFLVPLVMAWSPVRASTPDDSRLITPETTSHSIPTSPATATPGPPLCTTSWPNLPNCHSTTLNRLKLLSFVAGDLCHQFLAHSAGWHNAACYRTASYCKLWLNLGHSHGSPAERKIAMVIGRPLLKLNASTRGPRS